MTPFVQDTDFTLYVGDVLEVLAGLPDESVHCVVTSPPYWGLRDYGTGLWAGGDPDCDHTAPKQPDRTFTNGRGENEGYAGSNLRAWTTRDGTTYKDVCGKCGAIRVDQQLGLEATPELFVQAMVAVFREVRRVLRADGTCWVNLGDSYARGRTGRDDNGVSNQGRDAGWKQHPEIGSADRSIPAGLKDKDLVGIPWRVAFALQADGWYLRSDIVWAKPNPMPESVTDRPTKAHEYVFLLTRSPKYFFDQEAVREGVSPNTHSRGHGINPKSLVNAPGQGVKQNASFAAATNGHVTSRNIRSVWEIATQPYPEAHFATFPEALPERCIKAGTSERGCCPECGAPWERETDKEFVAHQKTLNVNGNAPRGTLGNQGDNRAADGHLPGHYNVTTTGWRPSCDHDLEPVPCTVLDIFMGSGTTALVARRLGRRSIGIELNPEYAALCARRLQQLSLLAGA